MMEVSNTLFVLGHEHGPGYSDYELAATGIAYARLASIVKNECDIELSLYAIEDEGDDISHAY